MYDDLIVIITPTAAEKQALVDDPARRSSRSTTSAASTPCSCSSPGSASSTSTSCARSSPTRGPSARPKRLVARALRCGSGWLTPPGSAAYDVLRAVRVDDAYANLVLPQAAARAPAQRPGRRLRHRARLRHAARGRAPTTPSSTPASTAARVQARVRDVLRLGAHQLLAMRVADHAAVSATVDLARARGRPRARPGSSTPCSARSRPHDLDDLARAGRPGPGDATRSATPRVAHSHPRWVVEELAAALGDRSARAATPARRRQRAAAGGAGRPARPVRRSTSCPGEPTRALAVRRACWRGGDPGAVPAVAEGRAGVQDEGSQLVALALAARRGRRARTERWLDLCAGPGGKAALLAALAAGAGRPAGRQRAAAAPRRLVARALAGADGVDGGHRARRHPPALAAAGPSTGSWSTRPAPVWGRCGAGPRRAGGASPSDLAELVPLQRALLASALDAGPPRRGRALRDLLPGARRDRRRASTRCSSAPRRRPARSRCRSTCPTPPDRCPGPSSCGRTGTAPTRCSWGCCDACDGSDDVAPIR